MVHFFSSVSIPKFFLIKHKTSKIIYTELSDKLKIIVSIAMITIYKPININSILFFIFFLLLISNKLYSSKYIAYKKISTNIIVIKFLFLIIILMLGQYQQIFSNPEQILYDTIPNFLVEFRSEYLIAQPNKIKELLHNVKDNCLKSIYKIEIASLISVVTSQLLICSIQPKNLLDLLKTIYIPIAIKSEINLVFSFSSQIYLLISEQINKLITALKIRSSNNALKNLLNYNKILELLFSYSFKKKYNLKKEIMTSAQINSSKLVKAQYNYLIIDKILLFSNKVLILLVTFTICFLVSI